MDKNLSEEIEKLDKATGEYIENIEAETGLSRDFAMLFAPFFMLRDAISQLGETVSSEFWKIYLNQGAVYGETDEGFARWLKELNEMIPDYRRDK